MERKRLLANAGLVLPYEMEAGVVPVDDVLDAAVAAWSAGRKARGEAQTLPVEPPVEDGRAIAIWYCVREAARSPRTPPPSPAPSRR